VQIETGDQATHRSTPSGSGRAEAPVACPVSPPRGAKGWRPYVGDSSVFHCGFDGYLEDRDPSPDHPVAECFYDEQGQLVDDNHAYRGCKGTPDSYGAADPRHWGRTDPGGIWNEGGAGLAESRRYFNDLVRDAMRKKGYPPYSIGPFRAPLQR